MTGQTAGGGLRLWGEVIAIEEDGPGFCAWAVIGENTLKVPLVGDQLQWVQLGGRVLLQLTPDGRPAQILDESKKFLI